MKNAPIVKYEALARLKLESNFVFLASENIIPQTNGLVELRNILWVVPLVHDRAVAVVPSDLDEIAGNRVVGENGLWVIRKDAYFWLTSTVCGYQSLGKKSIRIGILLFKDLGSLKAVNKHIFTAFAIVAKHVKELKSWGIAPVGTISVRSNVEVCVCCVIFSKVSGKVPKAAIVCRLDVRDALNKLLSGFWSDRDVFDKAKPFDINLLNPFSNAFFGLHDLSKIDFRPVSHDGLGIPEFACQFFCFLFDRDKNRIVGVNHKPFSRVDRLVIVRCIPNNCEAVFISRNGLGLDVNGDFKSVLEALLGEGMEVFFTLAAITKPDIMTGLMLGIHERRRVLRRRMR